MNGKNLAKLSEISTSDDYKNDDLENLRKFLIDYIDLEKLESMVSQFNIFESLRIVHTEIRHSNVIAWLCNPYESHDLGPLFIKLLIRNILTVFTLDGLSIFDFEGINYSNVDVRREWNNIDILVIIHETDREIIIAIENKIWSSEHGEQLKKYLSIMRQYEKDIMKSRGKDFNCVLIPILLTPGDLEPSDDNWWVMEYDHILRLIELLLVERARTLSQDVSVFLKHYRDILRRYIMQDNELIMTLCKDIYRKHTQALELIWRYRPDMIGDLNACLTELLGKETQRGLIIEAAGVKYIRFSTPALRRMPFDATNLGTKGGKLALYTIEFWSQRDDEKNELRIALKLIIFGGEQKAREDFFDHLKNSQLFKNLGKSVSKQYQTVLTIDLMSRTKYRNLVKQEGDGDISHIVQEKTTEAWDAFLKNKFDDVEAVVNGFVDQASN